MNKQDLILAELANLRTEVSVAVQKIADLEQANLESVKQSQEQQDSQIAYIGLMTEVI